MVDDGSILSIWWIQRNEICQFNATVYCNTSCRLLSCTRDKLDTSIALLKQFENRTLPPSVTNAELWEARRSKCLELIFRK